MATRVPPSTKPLPEEEKPVLSKDLAQPADYKKVLKNRGASKMTDPCQAAAKASQDCMDKANYNRDECLTFFQAYRDCKGKWLSQRREDRRAGNY
ncbi:hypothetical protein FFLO_03203 [Filobasidium floriforme]|uniref:Cytochrome c oxidase-assembly factor COX23, mitochondrial n=1 Tax=Filobasidium floriforme TaxID=5210 RepID=A0A8K0JLT1_9TREE|nr:uncharacterized protein HD553DRAFT_86098 [Filobasidium floriforme]KAG7548911.1 hypothetical protein FFLO_03203 [Filobasidium floriforme]KAH8081124.1 hypothetical protein HD553DRAFT_86098 [Filobasidium floriforme]